MSGVRSLWTRTAAPESEAYLQLETSPTATTTLWRELAEGQAISSARVEALTEELGASVDEATAVLGRFAERDETGNLVGVLGLSLHERHDVRLEVGGQHLRAWCVADTLGLAAALARPAVARSLSPATGDEVVLELRADGSPQETSSSIVMSAPAAAPDDSEVADPSAIWTKYCHRIHFFESRSLAEQWATGQHDLAIIDLADAHAMMMGIWEPLIAAGEAR